MTTPKYKRLSLGIDIGSTTAKLVVCSGSAIICKAYERHYSLVQAKTAQLLEYAREMIGDAPFDFAITGSAGLGIAKLLGAQFVQEVFATAEIVKQSEPDAACVIELGGEDAKMIFFDGGIDERMNGTCAGGTGAFIDQMATLLNLSVDELDELSLRHERIYPIASRCGVFAKTDIQALLNQGAAKEDVAASIYQAVVNQTIAGLAQGRRISGKVLFLGGPMYYCKGLRDRFKETLNLSGEQAVFPEYGRFAAALGASMVAGKCGAPAHIPELLRVLGHAGAKQSAQDRLKPLFSSEDDLSTFRARHARAAIARRDIAAYSGRAWLGIDCGSTTTKLVLISEDDELLYDYYASSMGSPVEMIRTQLFKLYDLCGERIQIVASAVTGYGEELIKRAFSVGCGVVETIAHYTAAKHFRPDVDFVLDIGGQDIKCFRIRNGAIDSIILNEACSSGCGSFLETFARALGYSAAEFAQKGLEGREPVNLGSRCTVFMNSSVKQAQKDGASIEDISAGLSISVIKNAIYKVIRASSPSELGEHIVVQGGTFLNEAVLRALERELGAEVIRPSIAGLMGAYGAALYSKRCKTGALISREKLEAFSHTSRTTLCQGCANHCHLTINDFGDGRRYISGNRCDKGSGTSGTNANIPNLYEYKRGLLAAFRPTPGPRGKLGIPLALGMYELLPLWHTLFTKLGFEVIVSAMSTRRTYELGQFSIPSDTACYPAKLMHGHIEQLLADGVDTIFYPCLTYNVSEKSADNHYNCPVVAYYSELLNGNVEDLAAARFLYPYLDITRPAELVKELYAYLSARFDGLRLSEVRKAVSAGLKAYKAHMAAIRAEGEAALDYARKHGLRIMILAGRPYHIDEEVCHGIDQLAASLGFVVVSEDSIAHLAAPPRVDVLSQWTYHARLYSAARYDALHDDTELVQLVSFGCGVDAITTDEVRSILERHDKYYTQLKIDEITNLGAVKIRLRSLIGALEERNRQSI